MKPIKKAVFPVAGLGTRILPATKAIPKEMLPLIDKPLIQYAVEEAFAAGIEQIIFVTAQGKTTLEDHFDVSPHLTETLLSRGKMTEIEIIEKTELKDGIISYVRQASPLGLGHAVWCARHLVGNEPFAVLLPDDFCMADTAVMKQMVDLYHQKGGNIVGVVDIPREETSRYGILEIGEDDGKVAEVKGLVEKPLPEKAPSTLSVIGRYILQPEIFTSLEKKYRGVGGEIQLTDAMATLIGRQPFHGLRFDGKRFDCGNKAGYVQATLAVALSRSDLVEETRAYLKGL